MKNIVRLIFIIIGISTSVYCCNLSDFEEPQEYKYSVTEPYNQVYYRIYKTFFRILGCEFLEFMKERRTYYRGKDCKDFEEEKEILKCMHSQIKDYKGNRAKVCEGFEKEKEVLMKRLAKDTSNIVRDSTIYLYSFASKCIISPVVKEMYIWTSYVQIFGSYNEKEAHAFMNEVIRIAKTFIFPKMNIEQKKNQNEIETKEDEEDIANIVNFPK